MNLLTPNIVKPGDQDVYEISFSGVQAGVDDRLDAIKVGTGMAVSNTGGMLTITTGTTANQETILRSQECFCGSLRMLHNMALSQRIANQEFSVELVDVIGDVLPYTINSTTSVTVQVPLSTFTAKDVGKKLFIGALSSVGTPTQATIASATTTSVTLTVVAWPASGSGTCSLFGKNFYQVLYDGTTATSAKFDSAHEGWGASQTAITIYSTALGGHVVSLHNDSGWARLSDAALNSNAMVQRAARLMNTPAPFANLVLQIHVKNLATAPASTTTMQIGFLKIERFSGTQVTLAGDKVVDVAQTVIGTVDVTGRVMANAGTTAANGSGWFVKPDNILVNDIASAAITSTTTTSAITPVPTGGAAEFNIIVTAVTGTTPTMDVTIQESDDAGTNWYDVYHFERITADGAYRSPLLNLTGTRIRYVQTLGGTTPSFTRTLNRVTNTMARPDIVRRFFDRTLNGSQALNAVTSVFNIEGTSNYQLVISAGTITTTAPAIKMQGSDDGSTWTDIGTPLTAVASSAVTTIASGPTWKFIRGIVSTAGVSATLNYVTIKAYK